MREEIRIKRQADRLAALKTQTELIEYLISRTSLNIAQICFKLETERTNFDKMRKGIRPMPKKTKELFLKIVK